MTYTQPVLDWYAAHARDLPWRRPGTSPWSVLVSEIMLQQTPVSRVIPAHRAWLDRWPTPAALASDAARRGGSPVGAARLPPARAAAARDCPDRHRSAWRHHSRCPRRVLALPGIGAYTAAAVAVFAFGRTARGAGHQRPARAEQARLRAAVPWPAAVGGRAAAGRGTAAADAPVAARWSVAVMELGALTCTAARPRCGDCPVAGQCAWLAAGRPLSTERRPGQRYEGTDRQCRGRLLAVLRESAVPVPRDAPRRGVARHGAAGPRAGRPGSRRPRGPAARWPIRATGAANAPG